MVPSKERRVFVSLTNLQRRFAVAAGQTLLDAALDAGINLPHSCKSGSCGSCRARLVDGDVYYPDGRPLGIAASEEAEGLVLLCRARARGDVAIEVCAPQPRDEVLIKRLPCRIERSEELSQDVHALYLRLPAAEPIAFQPGQYLDIMLPGGRRRSFSIASPPHDAALLELHVRRVPGGELTEGLCTPEARGRLLTIEAPLGHFTYQAPDPLAAGDAAPMLLVGGGTGLAPLKSMIRHVLENSLGREMILYWGVRGERDLYAHRWLEECSARAANFRYTPVLSEPSERWGGRRGLVHEAVLADLDDLSRHDVYASGPPAMIEAVRREFALRGVAAERLRFDSFDYAPDALERQRTRAATRS